jgi:hypothetical protein
VQLLPFEPQNQLEVAIVDARAGGRSIGDLIDLLVKANLYISSKREVMESGNGFEPLLLDGGGGPLIAFFSSLMRPELHRHVAKYVLQMNGREFLLRIPVNYGAILNPGYITQLIIPPESLADIQSNLKG